MSKSKLVFLGLLILPFSTFADDVEVHEKVQAALDYQIPLNDCTKPRSIERVAEMSGSGGEGDVTQSDVDSYTMDRVRRKEKRWETCVEDYKDELLEDFNQLKNSAQFGLTQDQAKAILQKMADIQAVVVTEDGIVQTISD
ncbi:MAG: hypothetical protein ABGY96_07905 [bacterium]|nr:hypothetical protein [Gammaproteobacteria bacterium]HIL97699.1 hypothetical protein [Pseudomonadales bacterium]